MPICDNCGMGLPVGYDYCFKCGYPVRGLPADHEAAASSTMADPPGWAQPDAEQAEWAAPDAGSGAPGWSAPDVDRPGWTMPAGGAGYAAPAATAHTDVLAPWTARLAAALIDYMLVSVIAAVIAVVGFGGSLGSSADILRNFGTSSRAMVVLEAAMLVCLFLYNVVAEALFHATLGKRVLGLRVVGYGGVPAGLGPVLVRNVTKIASCIVWFVGVPVALASIGIDRNHQRLGDRMAHTYVVREVTGFTPPRT